MTDALVQINDRLVKAARDRGRARVTFYCECGNCLADEVRLTPDEHEEIRVREDLIFAPGHDPPRRYRRPASVATRSNGANHRRALDSAAWRDLLTTRLIRTSARLTRSSGE